MCGLCEGFVGVLGMTLDQLKEIRANVGAALKEGAIMSNGNRTGRKKLNSTMEKIVDMQ